MLDGAERLAWRPTYGSRQTSLHQRRALRSSRRLRPASAGASATIRRARQQARCSSRRSRHGNSNSRDSSSRRVRARKVKPPRVRARSSAVERKRRRPLRAIVRRHKAARWTNGGSSLIRNVAALVRNHVRRRKAGSLRRGENRRAGAPAWMQRAAESRSRACGPRPSATCQALPKAAVGERRHTSRLRRRTWLLPCRPCRTRLRLLLRRTPRRPLPLPRRRPGRTDTIRNRWILAHRLAGDANMFSRNCSPDERSDIRVPACRCAHAGYSKPPRDNPLSANWKRVDPSQVRWPQ